MTHLSPAALSDARIVAAYVIFLASYVVFALGKFPGLKIDRTGAAIIGAVAMVAFRIVGPQAALRFIDFATIVLLFSMMLIVGNLHLVGFFEWNAEAVLRRLKPTQLLRRHLHLRILVGVLRQRHCVPGDGAVCAEHYTANEAGAASLLAGGGDGVEYWQRFDDHRESAKHADRIVFGNQVPGFSPASGASGGGGVAD